MSITTQSFKNEQKLVALAQKQQLNDLYTQKRRITLEEMQVDQTYYALNSEFLSQWKNFIRDSSRNDAPEKIDNSVLLCTHELLLFPPQKIDHTMLDFKYIIVGETDWLKLTEHYPAECVIRLKVGYNNQNEKLIVSQPNCCETCYEEQQKIERESLLNYERATIHVRRVQSKLEAEDMNEENALNDDDHTDKSFTDVS